jgi:hypothetical protein
MRRHIQITISVLIALTFLIGSLARAQSTNSSLVVFRMIYQSMVNTIVSEDSIAKKLASLKEQEKEYLRMAEKMRREMDKDSSLVTPADYLEVFKIYDQIIPLMEIELNKSTGRADNISCLRAQRLITRVATSQRPQETDPTLAELGLEGPSIAKLLAMLCR